jgi:SH3 domain protein
MPVKPLTLLTLILCGLLFTSTAISEDVRYVSNLLQIHSDKGNQFSIIHRDLPSSTKIYVLEVDEEGRWVRVKTEDGKQGWARSLYLIDAPTAANKLIAIGKAQQQLSTVENELDDLKKFSANAINLDLQHQKVLTKYQLLQTESDTNRAEIQRLENDNRHNQWLFGALLLICGIITTLIIQSMNQGRKKSDWG